MNSQHKNILNRCRQSIVDDVEVTNGVLDQLRNRLILTDADITRIQNEQNEEEMAKTLLDILPNCGPSAFDEFCRAIKKQWPWIVTSMNESLSRENAPDDRPCPRLQYEVPTLPLTVPREQKVEQLKTALWKLVPGHYVVLHGMKGFGKFCLAENTLKDTVMINECFNNQIYWIKFAYVYYNNPTEDEILSQLNSLYHRVMNKTTLQSAPESGLSKEDITKKLKHYFDNNQKSLLVLNDVWDRKIIEAFDFNCKTLVITTNLDLLGNRYREVIEMKDGFTLQESLGLFAKVLGVDVGRLPPEARFIHDECNGMPILIAMLASHFGEFKDDMGTNPGRWKHYRDIIRQKDRTNKVIEQFLKKQHAIFDMCIGQLSELAKTMYKQLAIFSEDVNITTETLSILWNKSQFSVDEHMLEICGKSLAAKLWNADLNKYIYGVHELLLNHLKEKLTPGDLSDLHRSFVEKYRAHCGGDFSKLPADNYGFSYIGYHLEQARMFEEYRSLYLDPNFIQAKISDCGLSDLLIDLRKYRKYIIEVDPTIEVKICEWETFLKSQARIIAEHRRRGCLDLVQIGINHIQQGFIYETARHLALSRPDYLYLIHEPVEETMSVEPPTEICTANFAEIPNRILIGNEEGNVILWDIETEEKISFSGLQKSIILKVIVSHVGCDFFLALNDNGIIKRFNFEQNDKEMNPDLNNLPSPREKQRFWSGIYRNEQDKSVTTYFIQEKDFIHVIEDFTLSMDDKKVAACTSKGTFRVWRINGDIICTVTQEKSFKGLVFVQNSNLLFLVDTTDGTIPIYRKNSYNDTYSYMTQYRPTRKILGPNPDGSDDRVVGITGRQIIYLHGYTESKLVRLIIITDQDISVILWEGFYDTNSLIKPKIRVFAEVDNSNVRYVAGTMTRNDGQYIITGDSEGFIKVWEKQIFNSVMSYTGRIKRLDTYWDNESGCHLIMGGNDRIIHQWTFWPENPCPPLRSPIKPLFDAVMQPLAQPDIVAQVNDKKIGLYIGRRLVTQTDNITGQIISICLSPGGNNILFVVRVRVFRDTFYEIKMYDTVAKTTTHMKTLKEFVEFVKFVKIDGRDIPVWKEGENLIFRSQDNELEAQCIGQIIGLHTIGNKHIATVSNIGKIIIWEVSLTDSPAVRRKAFTNRDQFMDIVSYSAINYQQSMLALLHSNGCIGVYEINTDVPDEIQIRLDKTENYNKNLTCCSFSPDGKYLAIGMYDGEIVIFDLNTNLTYKDPLLHCNAVQQLCWAPLSIDLPILLSLTHDEIAWWNINLMDDVQKMRKRNRSGLQRSSTTPTLGMSPRGSMRLPSSHTLELGNLAGQIQKTVNGGESNEEARQFWDSKVPKVKGRPALLALVQLPQSCQAKVCVSSDFQKFLLVDAHGSINTFKFFPEQNVI